MKERPIIFSAPMVRAILDGRKTQTRRIVKLTDSGRVKAAGSHRNWHLDDPDATKACPYGQPGDRLWVREGFATLDLGDVGRVYYRADGSRPPGGKWRSSLHMPRTVSRITLEIVGARVERLQEITEADAIAEGSLQFDSPTTFVRDGVQSIYLPHMGYAVSAFRALWDSINAKRAPWDSNPWVWVIEFRRAGE